MYCIIALFSLASALVSSGSTKKIPKGRKNRLGNFSEFAVGKAAKNPHGFFLNKVVGIIGKLR